MTAGEDVFRMIVSEVRADHRYANGSVMTVTVELQDEHRGASMSYGCALDDAPQVGDRRTHAGTAGVGMSTLPGVAVHQQLAIHRAMLEASGNINLTAAGDRILATCTVCHGERTFEQPVCLWDVLDMMGHHYRRNHR